MSSKCARLSERTRESRADTSPTSSSAGGEVRSDPPHRLGRLAISSRTRSIRRSRSSRSSILLAARSSSIARESLRGIVVQLSRDALPLFLRGPQGPGAERAKLSPFRDVAHDADDGVPPPSSDSG
jgi:hypothetical protein